MRECDRERETQTQLREQEIDLERYKMEKGVSIPTSVPVPLINPIKLVPAFDERYVTEFFNRFEKVATGNGWSKNCWSSLVQTVLTGNALKAYDCLPFGEAQDYRILKHAVLRTYEMRPD